MKRLKFIPYLLVGIFCLTACDTKTGKNPFRPSLDTSASAIVESNRQIFWDHLPQPTSWTNDYENLFTDPEKQNLNKIMQSFEEETTVQLCIVTLDTTHVSKQKFDDLALRIAQTWGIGQKYKNNGVTICISKGYKRIRICNGYGIEKILSDQETKEIIDKYFIPKFKEGKYFQGTSDGLLALVNNLRVKLNSK